MELVEAWGKVVSSGVDDWRRWKVELVYTVSGELEKGYEKKVKARVKELELQDQFIFTGALNDDEKWAAYARADLFVLPTYSENFGIVIAEALWAGVPAITTKGTPWAELETRKCGWWINVSSDGAESCDLKELVCSLTEATKLSDQDRYAMGMRGRQLIEHKYTWNMVCKEMVVGYKELEGKC